MTIHKSSGIGVRVGPFFYGRSRTRPKGEATEAAGKVIAGGTVVAGTAVLGAAAVVAGVAVALVLAVFWCLKLCWWAVKYSYLGFRWWWPRRQHTRAYLRGTWHEASDLAVMLWRQLRLS
jgi:hypothetical protein